MRDERGDRLYAMSNLKAGMSAFSRIRLELFAMRLNTHPWIPVILAFGYVVSFLLWSATTLFGSAEALIGLIGSWSGLGYFLYSRHLERTRFFKDLFTQFNERYDELNGPLDDIRRGDSRDELTDEERRMLVDYFNLCAEEYFFYRTGYVDSLVWQSWIRGMRDWAKVAKIRRLWAAELTGDSYYGFSLELLGADHTHASSLESATASSPA